MADELRKAVQAKDADGAASAYASLDASEPVDLKLLCAACNLMAFHRHNTAAFSAFERSLSVAPGDDGGGALVAAGLNLNALLYATCRDPAMLESARRVWDVLTSVGAKPELEPLEKLIGSCLKRRSHDEAFSVFLAAIDAGLTPSPRACLGLIRTCAAEPRLAQMSYAVFSTLKGSGAAVPPAVAAELATACLCHGTLEQAAEAYAAAAAAPADPKVAPRLPEIACQLAEACATAGTVSSLAQGGELLRGLRQAGHAGSPAAYEALIRAQCRAALARSRPAPARAAESLLAEMVEVGHAPDPGTRAQLVLACSRARLGAEAVRAFEGLVPEGGPDPAVPPLGIQPPLVPSSVPPLDIEPSALRAFAVMLAGAAADGERGLAGASVVLKLVRAHGSALAERLVGGGGDREHGMALLNLCCRYGLPAEAVEVFFLLASGGVAAATPGPSQLAELISGCSKTGAGVEAAAGLLPRLSRLPAAPVARLSPARCGDVWAALLDASRRTKRAGAGFRVYRELTGRGFEPEIETGLRLLLSLEEEGREAGSKGDAARRDAFELRAMLRQRGAVVPGGGGWCGAAVPGVGGASEAMEVDDTGGAAVGSAAEGWGAGLGAEDGVGGFEESAGGTASAEAAALVAGAEGAGAAGGEQSVHPALDSLGGGADPVDATKPEALLVGMPAGGAESVPPSRAHPAPPGRSLPCESRVQHHTLLRLLDEATSAERWDGALETLRQLGGEGVEEVTLLRLCSSLFKAGKAQHAVAVLEQAVSAGAATPALSLATISGLLDCRAPQHTVQAVTLVSGMEAAGEEVPLPTLVALSAATLRAGMLSDAEAIFRQVASARDAARAAAAPPPAVRGGKRKPPPSAAAVRGADEVDKAYRRVASDLLRAYTAALQLPQAFRLFSDLAAAGAPPSLALLSPLLERLCSRGMGPQAARVLDAMAEYGQPLSAKQVGEVLVALLRSSRPLAAFELFERYLEGAGSHGARVATLRIADKAFSLEHALALLTKALSKGMHGRRAHRVYALALSSGLISNFSSFGLPSLALACVEDSLLPSAVALASDARDALLPLDSLVASRILSACADARLYPQIAQLLPEVRARRLACDAPSLRRAHLCLRDATPPKIEEAAGALDLLAAARPPAGATPDASGTVGRPELRRLQHEMVEILCGSAKTDRAIRLMRSMGEGGVLPLPAAVAAVASASARVRSSSSLSDLVELVAHFAPRMPEIELAEAVSAAAAAGADVRLIGQGAAAPLPSGTYVPLAPGSEGAGAAVGTAGAPGGPRPPGRLSVGAGDVRAERAALDGMLVSRLQRDRSELQARVAQLTTLLARRTRALERVRLDVPEAATALAAAEAADAEASSEASAEAEAAASEVAVAAAAGGGTDIRRPGDGTDPTAAAELDEIRARYDEMMRVARERNDALAASQSRAAALERRVAALRLQLQTAGMTEEANEHGVSARAGELHHRVFAEVAVNSWFKPPPGWPSEVIFTNQLLWDEVPPDLHFFRHKMADYGAARRKFRTEIRKITSRKHPCYGAYGLYASEEIPKDETLFDYAGHVRLVVGTEHDTSTSSYLLNLFTHEDSQVYIDIDAARAGNEARFLNDHHGIAQGPNAQFWPYFDSVTGEKRMAVKSIDSIGSGSEIVVDYGGRYFERESSDDSDMQGSDEEFQNRSGRKKPKGSKGAGKVQALLGRKGAKAQRVGGGEEDGEEG